MGSGGPFLVPRWSRRHCARIRTSVESRLCHRAPIFRDVLLFHKPGARSVRPLEKSEGNKGLQERRVLAAEGSGWEGGETALACYRCQPDDSLERASGLHWCESRRPLQAFNIPLLGFLFFFVSFLVQVSAKSMW